MKTTNLDGVKRTTKLIAEAMSVEDDGHFGLAIHPFVNSTIWAERLIKSGGTYTQEQCDLTKKEVYKEWINEFSERVDKCKDLARIYFLWGSAWKLTFMKYCGEYLSEEDYAQYLADAWVVEENPNMDVNVSRKEAIKMFKSCKKEYLMKPEDLAYYNSLPEEITIWRGVGKGRIPLGLSWTDNKEKAEWFKNRWGEDANVKLLTATVNKKNVIAYFNTRGEQEILLDVFACKKLIREA